MTVAVIGYVIKRERGTLYTTQKYGGGRNFLCKEGSSHNYSLPLGYLAKSIIKTHGFYNIIPGHKNNKNLIYLFLLPLESTHQLTEAKNIILCFMIIDVFNWS